MQKATPADTEARLGRGRFRALVDETPDVPPLTRDTRAPRRTAAGSR